MGEIRALVDRAGACSESRCWRSLAIWGGTGRILVPHGCEETRKGCVSAPGQGELAEGETNESRSHMHNCRDGRGAVKIVDAS